MGFCKILIFQVVVAKEAVGSLGGLVRQLSLDQFENESRRMHPSNGDQAYPPKKFLNRQRSPQGLHKKVRIVYEFDVFQNKMKLF